MQSKLQLCKPALKQQPPTGGLEIFVVIGQYVLQGRTGEISWVAWLVPGTLNRGGWFPVVWTNGKLIDTGYCQLVSAVGGSVVGGSRMKQWIFLSVAIGSEVVATSALKASEGFSRLWPSLIVAAGYMTAFYFLSLTLRTIPVGVVYAIWSGVGIALIALIAWIFLGQSLDIPALIGLLLIIAGVVVLNLFSKTVSHS